MLFNSILNGKIASATGYSGMFIISVAVSLLSVLLIIKTDDGAARTMQSHS